MATLKDSTVDSIIVEFTPHDELGHFDSLEIDSRKVKNWKVIIDKWVTDERHCNELRKRQVDFVVEKCVLEKFSSYFRALRRFREVQGSREEQHNRIVLDLDVSHFFLLLGFFYTGTLEVPFHKVPVLLETCDFLGVDAALLEIERIISVFISRKNSQIIKDMVEYLPALWDRSHLCGQLTLKNICSKFLAINFVSAAAQSSFKDIPYALLDACVNHPQLTVDSEKSLYHGLIKWFEEQDLGQEASETMRGDLLNKVRASLIPLSVLFGRVPTKRGLDHKNQTIRITHFLESLDLSGCYKVDEDILFQSYAMAPLADGSLPGSPASNSASRVQRAHGLLSKYLPSRSNIWPSFRSLKMVNVSQCSKIPQDSLLLWLTEACPNLTQLIAKNCPQLTLNVLGPLSVEFPYFRTLDISLEATILVGGDGILKTVIDVQSDRTDFGYCIADIQQMRFLTCLSLRGRTELHDEVLNVIVEHCPELVDLDLSMCTSLSDYGMSYALDKLPRGLQHLKARHANIGQRCCDVLGSTSRLQTLDLEGCHGLPKEEIAFILMKHPSLQTLCLDDTKVDDTALFGFKGSGLENLHLRDTKVSVNALHYVIKRNLRLTNLDVRGCTRVWMRHKEGGTVSRADYDERYLCHHLRFDGTILKHVGLRGLLRKSKVGLRFSFCGLEAMSLRLGLLKSLEVGVGGNFCNMCVERIPFLLPSLEKLRLDFKGIDVDADGFKNILQGLPRLQVLEIQNTFSSISANCIAPLMTGCLSNVKVLRLDRFVTLMSDNELLQLSRTFSNLSHFTLVGCKNLTSRSLVSISQNMGVLIELRLEECEAPTKSSEVNFLSKSCERQAGYEAKNGGSRLLKSCERQAEYKGLTSNGGNCLLKSCETLERLILRHNGKGLEENFVLRAMKELPYLWFLSLDICDSVTGGFCKPESVRIEGLLNTLMVSRCVIEFFTSFGRPKRCHKDTALWSWRYERTYMGKLKRRIL